MIPNEHEITALWDEFGFPEQKRTHVRAVARVALFFVRAFLADPTRIPQGEELRPDIVLAAALLHDLDKNMVKLPGDRHPDAAVRELTRRGMDEVAAIVTTHPLHAILVPDTAPRTLEQKIVFLADKMAKYEVIGVDARFALWQAEHLPAEAQRELDAAYPLVKSLEKELCDRAGISREEMNTLR